MKKLMMMFAVACLSLTALSGCSTDSGSNGGSGENTSDKVKIGLHYELTGEAADYGNKELKGSKLAIKLANEAGGNFEAVEMDDKSSEEEAVSVSTNLMSQGVVGVVGPATSGASAATYPVSEQFAIPVISPSATANGITFHNPSDPNSGVYETAWRICFEDSYQGAAMATFAYDTLKAKKVVVYFDNSTDYSKGLKQSFETKFVEKGGEIVAVENYQSGDTDFNSVLTKIKGMDFDMLYLPGYYNEVGLIIDQAKKMGIETIICGGDGFESTDLIGLAGGAQNLNDIYFTTSYTTVNASDALQKFIDDYKAEYNEDPNLFSALAYDATNLLIQAANEAGNDPAAVNEYLKTVKFDGITGSFTFDETHTPVKSVLVTEMQNGVQISAVSVNP